MTLQGLKAKAAKLGAVVELDANLGGGVYQVVAPDGKQWVSSDSVHLSAEYWKHAPETKNEALTDLADRMNYGFDDITEENA